jgi:cytochrome c553
MPNMKLGASFESIRQNIIVPKCVKCHKADSPSDASKILFATEDQLLTAENDEGKILVLGNALESTFYRVMTSDSQIRGDLDIMPPEKEVAAGRSTPVSPEELRAVELWINTLGRNNPPTPGDLWSQVQTQVITAKCVTCHKAGGKAKNIPFESKEQLLTGSIDGKPLIVSGDPINSPFFDVLNTDSKFRNGYKKMPPQKAINSGTVSDVDDADRKLVRDWIISLVQAPPGK